MELISVIVPVYNVEKYLKKCIDSLLQQTYQNLQIILVDDGSTDSSGIIADAYEQEHERIEVHHKKNGGLSDARNCGLKYAKGKYVCFLDSDDWVTTDMIETLYRNIKENDADVSEAQYIRVEDENQKPIQNEEKVYVFDNIQASINLRNYQLNQIVAWNKMYKKECFENIKFPFGKIHEDEFTTYKVLYACKKIVVSTKVLFFYRNTPNSIMNKKFSRKRLHVIEAYDEAIAFYEERKEKELKKLTIICYLYILLKIKEESNACVCEERVEINDLLRDKFVKLYKQHWKILLASGTGIKLCRYLIDWR